MPLYSAWNQVIAKMERYKQPLNPPGVLAVISLVLFTALASASGFIREVVLAFHFGTSASADSIAVIIFYIDSFNTIILSGVAGLSVVPYLARMRAADKYSEGLKTIFVLTLFMAAVALIASSAICFNAEELASLLLQSHSEQDISIASQLFAYSAFAFVPLVIANVLFSVMQAEYKYNLIPFARIAFNTLVIGAIILASYLRSPQIVAWGVLLGVLMQLFIAIFNIRKICPSGVHINFLDPEILGIIKIMYVPLAIVILTNFIYGTVELYLLSSVGEGTIAGVKYANRLVVLINGINASLQIVFFTRAGKECAQHVGSPSLAGLYHRIAMQGLLVLIPISVLISLESDAIVRIAFERGSFGADSVFITSSSLSIYALSVGGAFLWGMAMRLAFLAGKQWYGLMMAAVFFVSGLLTSVLCLPHLGHLAIPVGFTTGCWAAAFSGMTSLVFLVKERGIIRKLYISLFQIVLLTAISALAPLLIKQNISGLLQGGIFLHIAHAAVISAVFFAVYLCVGWLTNIADFRQTLVKSINQLIGKKS